MTPHGNHTAVATSSPEAFCLPLVGCSLYCKALLYENLMENDWPFFPCKTRRHMALNWIHLTGKGISRNNIFLVRKGDFVKQTIKCVQQTRSCRYI